VPRLLPSLSASFVRGAAALALAGLLAGCATYQPPAEPPFYRSLVAPGSEVDAAAAASMVSGFRANNGLGPVTMDPELNRLAKQHSQVQAAKMKTGHDIGDGTLEQRAKAAGYKYTRIAENVAGGYHTLAEAFSGWRDSSGHRKNMLMPQATRIGVAVAQAPGSKYKVFWTMILAEPGEPKVVVLTTGAPLPSSVPDTVINVH